MQRWTSVRAGWRI